MAGAICAVLVAVNAVFIDRPVERYVVSHFTNHKAWWQFYDVIASPSLLPGPLAALFLPAYAIRRLAGRPPGRHTDLCLRLSLAVAIAVLAKDELKWLIGRPWPEAWVHYHLYVPRPLNTTQNYGGFPSGHTTLITAPMFVLWWRLPREYRPLWLGVILAVMVGLVGSGHHFIGDTIGGFFTGLAAAYGTLICWPERPAREGRRV